MRSSGTHLRLLIAAALAGGLCCRGIAPAARAQETTTRPADSVDEQSVRGWFADLANRDAEVREQARIQLMGLPREQLPLLRHMIEEDRPLAPSQVAVLREIVAQVYLAGEPYESSGHEAFLGIVMSPGQVPALPPDVQTPGQTGVVVGGREAGFCGRRMLRDGDVILGLADRPDAVFRTPEDLKNAIQVMRPGQTLRLAILRHGQVKHVSIMLDAKPAEAVTLPALELWENRRMEKFDQYWQRAFAPLLKQDIS